MTTRQRWTLVAAVLGSGIVFLDSTVVTVALPRIGQDLPTPRLGVLEAQAFVYNAYLLSLSATLILAGALTDHLGRRRVFTGGLVGFGITSLLCGVAPSMELLIVFRILQGAAGAFLVPGALALLTAAFTMEEQQGRAFGIWAGASAVTTIVGPVVGGVLVDAISWRAVFLINLPLLAFAVWATSAFVEESRDEEAAGHFDWVGAVVGALAVGGLTLGLIRGQESQWESATAWIALLVGTGATIAFPVLMVRTQHPLVPPELFARRNFTVTNISTFVIYGALYTQLYLLTIYLQGTLGYTATAAGIATVPGMILLAALSARFGALAGRYGPRWFMAAGPAIMAVGALLLALVEASSASWNFTAGEPSTFLPPADYLTEVLPGVVLFGAGAMVMVAPLTTALMGSIPLEHAGVGSGINNAISRIGPQIAGALIFVAVTATFYGALSSAAPELDPADSDVRAVFAPLNAPAEEVTPAQLEASKTASTDAFRLAMLLAAGLYVIGAAINAVGITGEHAVPAEVEPTSVAGQHCAPVPCEPAEA